MKIFTKKETSRKDHWLQPQAKRCQYVTNRTLCNLYLNINETFLNVNK